MRVEPRNIGLPNLRRVIVNPVDEYEKRLLGLAQAGPSWIFERPRHKGLAFHSPLLLQ